AAWLRAVEHARIVAIEQAEHPLMLFYTIQSRFAEGTDAFAKALELLDNGDSRTEILLAKVLCDLGWMYLRQGELEKARVALERSWQLYAQHDLLPTPGKGTEPRIPLSTTYNRLGNFVEAEKAGKDAYRDHTLREDHFNLAFACYV